VSKLDAALRWAARGFRVFPLQQNSREPTDLGWTNHATTDPDQIRRWWTDPVLGFERDLNIGCLATGRVIVDVDVKNGKPGLKSHSDLGFDWDTLTVRTTTNGFHAYYQGLPDRLVGGSPLAPGLDIRSHNGYVVAPGSTIDGVEYTVELDLPVAEFPEHLRDRLKAPRQRQEATATSAVDLDTPEAIEMAAHWLVRGAPVAIEGRNGDDTTFRVACKLRDFGLSEETAFDLLLDEYNPRCEPPWSPDDLHVKVENAYRYASGSPGSAHPAATFSGVEVIPLPPTAPSVLLQIPETSATAYQFGNMLRREEMTERPWILGDVLISQVVSLLVGAGGTGKSLLSLTIAAHVVLGRPFLGWEVKRSGRVVVYDAEDSREEQSRRLHAICAVYGLPENEVRAGLSLNSDDSFYGGPPTSADEVPGLRVTQGNRPARVNVAAIAELTRVASAPDVALVIVGPLTDMHTSNENDNPEMNYVMHVLRSVARLADVAVMVVHHTGKVQANAPTLAGSQDAGRGASALAAKARVVMTLFRPSEEDCGAAGIPADKRQKFARLDIAKANLSGAPDAPRWLRWRDASISTGDSVGVLVQHDGRKAAADTAENIARVLRDRMLRAGRASLTLAEAVAALQDADAQTAKQDVATVRAMLLRVLVAPVAVDGMTVRATRTVEGNKTVVSVTMS
jgi:hypothetical protein